MGEWLLEWLGKKKLKEREAYEEGVKASHVAPGLQQAAAKTFDDIVCAERMVTNRT